MPKFLIEVPHGSHEIECLRSAHILLSTGSHFLTNAEWGCHDGVHKAWFIAEVASREEALMIVPSFYRKDTTVTLLTRFTLREVEELIDHHPPT
jgi:hypothetical protein